MEPTKKAKKSLFQKFLDFFLPLGEKISIPVDKVDRIRSLVRTFGFGLFLGSAFITLVYIVAPPENQEGFWKKIFSILENYPTIILVIPSLPVAFVLWLFRNHDIVMNRDLDKYHEAVRNIHDYKASEGLRQVAFVTLMELKEKSTWKEKIRKDVFPRANLENLNAVDYDLSGAQLYGAQLIKAYLIKTNLKGSNLSGAKLTSAKIKATELNEANLQETELYSANLTGATLMRTILYKAKLHGAYYYRSEEARQKKERTAVTKKWLRERGALNVDTVEGIVEDLNLTEVNLQGADLRNFFLKGAYYYKDDGAKINDIRTLVTKRWLRERGAKNVDTVYGIDE